MVSFRSVPHIAFFLAAFFLIGTAGAVFVEERLENQEQEARARNIAEEIRCLVCQNQSIMDSNADLAKDLRGIVRERVAAGDSDDQVRDYLVARYGDWVLLNPPFRTRTMVLWLSPFVILIFGAFFMVRYLRRRATVSARAEGQVPALSVEEEAELAKLMNDKMDGDSK
jgi:cytochrome c-type biogenesis protein CcmH